jgi:hypothetical protein
MSTGMNQTNPRAFGSQDKETAEDMTCMPILIQSNAPLAEQHSFRVSFDVDVDQVKALWQAAAVRGLRYQGQDLDDVEEVIGPLEDPDIIDCLAMITAPSAISGCTIANFKITPVLTCDDHALAGAPGHFPVWENLPAVARRLG